MEQALEHWLTTFADGAGTSYEWEITARGWLRTCTAGWCPLLAQWTHITGEIVPPQTVFGVGERQGLSQQVCSQLIRAEDRNPTGYDATLRARLLSICHVEES